MRYAIISDIHANESALRHVLADAKEAGAEKVVCLGDVVGYGPLPKEALALVRGAACIVVAGNHDDAVSQRQGADGFIDLAGDAVQRHREALDAEDLAWLRSLPYAASIEGAGLVHGDFTDPKGFYYVENEEDARANFESSGLQLMFVGHTHTPCIFLTGQSGNVYRLQPQDFILEDGKRYIVNPGSVGYPRETNGECYSSYVLYDSAKRQVSFRKLPFAVSSVMQRGKTQRRSTKRIITLCAAIAACGIGAAIVLAPTKTRVETVTVEVEKPVDPSLTVAGKSLTVGRDARFVRANLKLDAESDPVVLQTEFLSANGESIHAQQKTVKRSACDRVKIPPQTVTVRFTVTKERAKDNPKIESFVPAASLR